jgi:F-type H+-transporting ATPase subunit delta
MPEPGLARRYAVALFEAAKHREQLDRVEADLEAVADLLRREPSLREFMLSPQVLDQHKEDMLHRTLEQRVSPLTHHFLLFLLRKRRFEHVELIYDSLSELLDVHRGIVRAVVTTAVELKTELRDRLRLRLQQTTGKRVELEARVNPAIIGGAVVILGDQLVDMSVRREIGRVRQDLMAARVI